MIHFVSETNGVQNIALLDEARFNPSAQPQDNSAIIMNDHIKHSQYERPRKKGKLGKECWIHL